MRLPSRELAEASVLLSTTAALSLGLVRSAGDRETSTAAGNGLLAWLLAALTVAALLAERGCKRGWGDLYRQREAGSSGLALGSLALPWLFAGLAIQQQQQQHSAAGLPPAQLFTACASIAASAGQLLSMLCMRHSPQALEANGSNARGRRHDLASTPSNGALARLRLPSGVAALVGCCAASLAALLQTSAAPAFPQTNGGPLTAAALLVASALCAAQGTHALLALLPRVFTAGEAMIASQAAMLLAAGAAHQLVLAGTAASEEAAQQQGPFQQFVVFLTAGSLLATAVLLPLLQKCRHVPSDSQRSVRSSSKGPSSNRSSGGGATSSAWVAIAVAGLSAAALALAAAWALKFAASSRRRLLLCGWWAADLAAALPAQHWINRSGAVPPILVRKGYHLLALSLFLPALLLEPQLLALALAGAFALLLAAEVARLSGLPGIASRLHDFMTSFTDGRDSGLLLITHFTLLLGMAAPVWLSNAPQESTLGAADSQAAAGRVVQPAAYAGILIIGLGDTAASAVGSLLGRHPICRGSSKTLEGTSAAVTATLAGWWLLDAGLAGAGLGLSSGGWAWLAAVTALSCLLEAVTTQLDNIFVPLHYFALLCML